MLIDFLRDSTYDHQYFFENDEYHVSFSSNNNLSFLKSAYKGNMQYPKDLNFGEDVYICVASIKNKNRYMVNKDMQILHLPRTDLISFIKQFFYYGSFFVSGIHRNKYKNFEFFYKPFFQYKYVNKHRNIKFKFPVPVLIYLGTLHVFVLCALLSLVFPAKALYLLGFGFLLYFGHDLRLLSFGLKDAIRLSFVKFSINMALLLGNLVESIKRRCLITNHNVDYPDSHILLLKVPKRFKFKNQKQKELIDEINQNKTYTPFAHQYGNRVYVFELKGQYILVKLRKFFCGFKLLAISENLNELLLQKEYLTP